MNLRKTFNYVTGAAMSYAALHAFIPFTFLGSVGIGATIALSAGVASIAAYDLLLQKREEALPKLSKTFLTASMALGYGGAMSLTPMNPTQGMEILMYPYFVAPAALFGASVLRALGAGGKNALEAFKSSGSHEQGWNGRSYVQSEAERKAEAQQSQPSRPPEP